MKTRLTRFKLAALALFVVSPALAQTGAPVKQSGSVTPGHVPMWTTNGVIQDGGSAAQGFLTSLGVTASGPSICQNSGPITGPYNQICLDVTATGGFITFQNVGGATGTLSYFINGSIVPITGGSGTVGPGVNANVLHGVSGNYQIAPFDCGSTIYATGGFFTVTLPAVNGFATNCSVVITNGDSGRGKALSGFPAGFGSILWPGKSVNVAIQSGAVWVNLTSPTRYQIAGSINVYVDRTQGSDSNDCLAPGASACMTSAQAMTNIARSFDDQGTITIQYGCASTPCTYTDLPFIAQKYVGSGAIIIQGDTTTPDNFVMNCVSCSGGALFNFPGNFLGNSAGSWTIQGFKTQSSLSGGAGIQSTGESSIVSFQDMDFGTLTAGNSISCIGHSQMQSIGNYTISGSAATFAFSGDHCDMHLATGVGTLTGSPVFSTAFIQAHGLGLIGTSAANFSGSAGSPTVKCTSDLNSVIDVGSGGSGLPGTAACTVGTGGMVD